MHAAFEEVVGAVVLDYVGVVGHEVSLDWEGVVCCLGEGWENGGVDPWFGFVLVLFVLVWIVVVGWFLDFGFCWDGQHQLT